MAAFDPVCNMTVEEDEAAATAEYDGKTYYFCSAACRKDFEERPRGISPPRVTRGRPCGSAYLPANTNSAISAAASSCIAGMACE